MAPAAAARSSSLSSRSSWWPAAPRQSSSSSPRRRSHWRRCSCSSPRSSASSRSQAASSARSRRSSSSSSATSRSRSSASPAPPESSAARRRCASSQARCSSAAWSAWRWTSATTWQRQSAQTGCSCSVWPEASARIRSTRETSSRPATRGPSGRASALGSPPPWRRSMNSSGSLVGTTTKDSPIAPRKDWATSTAAGRLSTIRSCTPQRVHMAVKASSAWGGAAPGGSILAFRALSRHP
mmetsp:Transcript_24376/g.57633  ORF Transcript_24376/g.57633 Transcript_24376/m.57633 type:complete len:240 (-) Transcript_24376:2-721(-)